MNSLALQRPLVEFQVFFGLQAQLFKSAVGSLVVPQNGAGPVGTEKTPLPSSRSADSFPWNSGIFWKGGNGMSEKFWCLWCGVACWMLVFVRVFNQKLRATHHSFLTSLYTVIRYFRYKLSVTALQRRYNLSLLYLRYVNDITLLLTQRDRFLLPYRIKNIYNLFV